MQQPGPGSFPEVIQTTNLAGRLANAGLGSPYARGIVAGAIVGAVCYSTCTPGIFFRKNGLARPWSMNSQEKDAMQCPFFLVPLTAAAVAFLVT